MPDIRHATTSKVRQQLVISERSHDRSMAEAARLIACILDSGARLHAATEVAQEAVEEACAALASGLEMRRRFVATHQRLAEVAATIGIDIVNTGGAGNKRPDEFFTSASAEIVELGQAA